ncbi:DNA alkylation repair protein [Paenibacillus sp. GYB004]|uniref:DNA alkylation repair protein n=1 Tax=Paenibacillus sp. GYB004 TaxID=2994393 RepID=UPI002F963825
MKLSIREQLLELADEEYRKFSSSLLPTIDHVIGVRLPELRKLAKSIARSDWRTYLKQAEDDYFEEVMLQGMVIGYAKAELEELLSHVADFVPKIDNWSVCDSFCTGLKFTPANKRRVWAFIQPYLRSENEYELRFGIVMLLFYYVDEPHIQSVLSLLDSIRHDGYYVKMAVAWALSVCYVKQPEKTMNYLLNHSLDAFTYIKALQKITESNRVSPETKLKIRQMKQNVSKRQIES